MKSAALTLFFASIAWAKISTAPYFFPANETYPLILGHRGSTGLFPEHSHASYSAAYNEEVDFVELDLQLTKDGYLVTSHDPFLKETTDILKYKDKYIDRMGGWDYRPVYGNVYTDDFLIRNFTLAELKQLRRNQRYAIRNQDLNGIFEIMTLEETIELMFQLQKDRPFPHRKHKIGLYIETKMYEFYL